MHARPARCVMHVVFGMHGPAHGGAVWAGGHCATAKRHWRGAGWGRQSCEREQHPAQRTVHGLLVLIDASCRWSPRMPPGRCPPSSSLCLQERLHHQVAWLRARTVIRAHSPAYNGITWSLLHLAAVQHSALRTPHSAPPRPSRSPTPSYPPAATATRAWTCPQLTQKERGTDRLLQRCHK